MFFYKHSLSAASRKLLWGNFLFASKIICFVWELEFSAFNFFVWLSYLIWVTSEVFHYCGIHKSSKHQCSRKMSLHTWWNLIFLLAVKVAIETQHMVNFGQKTAILSHWNSWQKKNTTKMAWNHFGFTQKKKPIEFCHIGFPKKDLPNVFKNTHDNRHVGSAESTYSGQRCRPFWEESVFNVEQRCQQELVKRKIQSRIQDSAVFSNFFFSRKSLKYNFFLSLQKYTTKPVKF